MNFIMIGLLLREALDRLRVRLNMYLVCSILVAYLVYSFIWACRAMTAVAAAAAELRYWTGRFCSFFTPLCSFDIPSSRRSHIVDLIELPCRHLPPAGGLSKCVNFIMLISRGLTTLLCRPLDATIDLLSHGTKLQDNIICRSGDWRTC